MRQGEIDAIVYATGTNTYFGKTAALVEQAQHHDGHRLGPGRIFDPIGTPVTPEKPLNVHLSAAPVPS